MFESFCLALITLDGNKMQYEVGTYLLVYVLLPLMLVKLIVIHCNRVGHGPSRLPTYLQ